MTDKQKDIKIKTICNCCLICHEGTNNPNSFYICDKCKAKLKIEDSISRQAVVEMAYDLSEIDGEHFAEPHMVVDVEDIQNAPSVTPAEKVGHWIPVSERLPDLDNNTGSRVWQKKVLITGYLSFDDTKELFVSEAFAEDVVCNSVHDTVVTAWMPLPETYKPESEVSDANSD